MKTQFTFAMMSGYEQGIHSYRIGVCFAYGTTGSSGLSRFR